MKRPGAPLVQAAAPWPLEGMSSVSRRLLFTLVLGCGSTTVPPVASPAPLVVAPATAPAPDPCVSEPWSWLPDDPSLARMSIDAEAIRASRYADVFVRHFHQHDAAAVVDAPMRRMAVAYRADGGSVVVMRTGLARETGLPLLAEDVVAVSEGSLTGYRPSFRCGAPEEGLFYAVFSPEVIPQVRLLALLGISVKTITARMWMENGVLRGDVALRFLTPLEPGPIVDGLLQGLRVGMADVTSSVPEVAVSDTDITMHFVARTDAEAEQWIAHLAQMTSDTEPEPVPASSP